MGYRIGSFNLRNIGTTALGDSSERDLGKIAEIILKEKFDVVALQEVLSEGKAFVSEDFAKKSILMHLGKNWKFAWANAEADLADRRNEGYAFVWNSNRLQPVTVEVDGKERVFKPRICKLNKSDLKRRPYYARFTPVGTSGSVPWIELRLLCVHTYFGKDTNEDRAIRQNELDVLMKEIYPQISDRRYGLYGSGMPSYTILMGDYNVQLWREWKEAAWIGQNAERAAKGLSRIPRPAYLVADENDVIETTKWGGRKVKTVQYEFTTIKSDGGGYAHDYDHFSYEEEQFKGIGMKVRRVDAVRDYYGNSEDSYKEYHKKISDHIPILMDIDFKLSDELLPDQNKSGAVSPGRVSNGYAELNNISNINTED